MGPSLPMPRGVGESDLPPTRKELSMQGLPQHLVHSAGGPQGLDISALYPGVKHTSYKVIIISISFLTMPQTDPG